MSVKIPQALHEDFVLLGHSRCLYKGLRDALVFRGLVKIEEDVVENGVLVMHRHVGFADLLVQLLQRIVGLGRVDLSCEGEISKCDGIAYMSEPTLGDSHCPQNTVDEECAIEAFATSLDVGLGLAIVWVRRLGGEYMVDIGVVEHFVGFGSNSRNLEELEELDQPSRNGQSRARSCRAFT